MTRAKKQDTAVAAPAWLRRWSQWFWGAGRPVLIVLLAAAAVGGGSYFAWQYLKPRITALPEYQVTAEQVAITPLPPWIHRDVRGEVFGDPRLDGRLSILDDDLLDRIKEAFARHPWVAKVVRLTKQHPARINVELVYRQPACMVEVPGGLLAVDAEGVLLPSEDFSPLEAARYPRLLGVDRRPTGPAGFRWGDGRVIGGAEIAVALKLVWDSMRLYRIVSQSSDPATTSAVGHSGRRAVEPVFVLLTRGGTRIVWGYAPGANVLGELSAAEKVARLKQYVADHDALDTPQKQEFDLRLINRSHERRFSQPPYSSE
jgi:hypothetical protein